MRSSTRTLLAIVTCCTVGLGTLVVGYRTLASPTKFSPTVWKVIVEENREAMARDFIANHFRRGMSRAEVVALLGEPNAGFQELHYVVGSDFIDYVVLWVELNTQGNAVRAVIHTTK
jgi:hypothetical protein